MSAEIRATVRQARPTFEGDPLRWRAMARYDGSPDAELVTFHHSWAEAMLDAYRLRSELDAELMDAVNAERAARRPIPAIQHVANRGRV